MRTPFFRKKATKITQLCAVTYLFFIHGPAPKCYQCLTVLMHNDNQTIVSTHYSTTFCISTFYWVLTISKLTLLHYCQTFIICWFCSCALCQFLVHSWWTSFVIIPISSQWWGPFYISALCVFHVSMIIESQSYYKLF